MKLKGLIFSIIVLAFLSSAISVDRTIEVGKEAPKIETVDGTNVAADANTKGKTQVVSFWSPKKPASRIANRNLSRQYGADSNENVEFISICIDSDDDLMREVIKVDGIDSLKNYSYSQISPKVFKAYDVETTPRAFKISPEGIIMEIL